MFNVYNIIYKVCKVCKVCKEESFVYNILYTVYIKPFVFIVYNIFYTLYSMGNCKYFFLDNIK